MKRIMGIDYGDARTGIAISDLLCSLVGSTLVINSRNPEKTLEQIVQLVQQNFMQTMSHMGAGPTGLTQPIGGGGGAVSKSSPTEDDETESGKPRNAQAHTPATDRMAQRINDAVRP